MQQPMDIPTTFSLALKERLENRGMSKYAFGKALGKRGHKMSWLQLTHLLEGRIPTRRWDSLIVSIANVLGTTPYLLMGLPYASRVYDCDPKKRGWPYPLLHCMHGHSVGWLARELKLPYTRVAGWVGGNLPPIERLWDLASVLECEVTELFPVKEQSKDIVRRMGG